VAAYTTIDEVRAEGVGDAVATDEFLQGRIDLATAYIELFTGWWFEPREMTLRRDGNDKKVLRLEYPIISITSLTIDDAPVDLINDVVIYNRHLSGDIDPDDRRQPRIEFREPLISTIVQFNYFTKRQQNVVIEGKFGYTDPDVLNAPDTGITPLQIKFLAIKLVLRELALLNDLDERDERQLRYRWSRVRTRDQEIELQPLSRLMSSGSLTGDPDIDRVLLEYRRPMRIYVA
jgi:hypothetical protein